ncbi:MAG: radical SAM protein [Elusimicrobiales bacterium]|nr:radical SAM protein [Elusimicrobiales bacterium]
MVCSLEELHNAVVKANHQRSPWRHPLDFFHVMAENWADGLYMLRKFGWRSWHTFWFTKLFVVDEGGEYDFLAPLLRRWPNLLKKPFKIEVEHTTVCNKKCIFCMHTHWNEKQEQMSFENYKKLVDSIPCLKWINLAGLGSAFLHKDFIKMAEYARARHINFNFVDEFEFFDEEKARKIVELGVNSIYVSFDAAKKETYETIKKGCDYDTALRNLKTLLRVKEEMKSPFPVVHFRFLVTKLNYREMPAYMDLIASLPNRGARARVEFIGLITFPGIEDQYMPLSAIPEDIVAQVYERAIANKINLYFAHSDNTALPDMSRCVRWTEPFVLVDGNIISDCAILMQGRRNYLKSVSLGNLFETPMPDIWNSARYKAFRNCVVSPGGKVPKSCANCCAFSTAERAARYGITEEFFRGAEK